MFYDFTVDFMLGDIYICSRFTYIHTYIHIFYIRLWFFLYSCFYLSVCLSILEIKDSGSGKYETLIVCLIRWL